MSAIDYLIIGISTVAIAYSVITAISIYYFFKMKDD